MTTLTNPDFPPNRYNLVNGSVLICSHPDVQLQLGTPLGKPIILGWTGRYVRFGAFTWDVEQICEEIDGRYWNVTGKGLDLSNAKHLELFNRLCSPELDKKE